MSWRQSLKEKLDPRLHLSSAIGWAVVTIVTLAALAAAGLASTLAERRARTDAQRLLTELATQARDAVSMSLEMRRLQLQAVASQITWVTAPLVQHERVSLQRVQERFPEFAWIGIVDAHGRVLVASGEGVGPQEEMAGSSVVQEGRLRPVVRERLVPPAVAGTPEDKSNPLAAPQDPRRIVMATPLDVVPGGQGAVLVTVIAWRWVEQTAQHVQQALASDHSLDLLIAARDGTVLVGPPSWLGRRVGEGVDLTEGGRYVVGTRRELRLADNLGLGWTAMVRQSARLTFESVQEMRETVFLVVFAAGLLAAAGAVLVTRLITRRLELLAQQAEAVRAGRQDALDVPGGADEVRRIGQVLAQVVGHLQTEKRALQTLNADLDARVAERTVRIERMAEEARHAAVSRERLRIARDMHDTLAHSLMALLTQIRLVRKLRRRLSEQELDDELERAEGVAASGLREARAAIAQMRDNGVREVGLGPAVSDLARRAAHRSGIPVQVQAAPQAADWTDDRFETLFRVVEEALRNAERHAHAGRVTIRLGWEPASDGTADVEGRSAGQARIEVEDDGTGFDPTQQRPGHYGLRGMREQAALAGAQLSIDSEPGRGSCVRLRLAL